MRLHPFILAASLAGALLGACSSDSGTPPVDAGINFCAPPVSYAGNEKHIGAGCTKGGDECSRYSTELLSCSIDLDPEGSTFCIKIGCSSHEACGSDACCTGREGNPIHACVPKACVEENGACPAIPGTSAPDAGLAPDSGA